MTLASSLRRSVLALSDLVGTRRRPQLLTASEVDDVGTPLVLGEGVAPLLTGDGGPDFACGHCGIVLVKCMPASEFIAVLLKCSDCGWFNHA